MGYRRAIHNIPIEGQLFNTIKNSLKEYNLQVNNIFKVRKRMKKAIVYMVELDDGKHVRVDNYIKGKVSYSRFEYQKFLYDNGVNVAKIIGLPIINGSQWKVSEWIEGVRLEEVWNDPEVFEKSGEQIAKINSTKDPGTNQFLVLSDFSPLNLIWTKKKEVYIIDLLVSTNENVDYSVVKTLIMGLRTKNRSMRFLDGYKKIRDVDGILKILEESRWKWKQFELEKDPLKDIME